MLLLGETWSTLVWTYIDSDLDLGALVLDFAFLKDAIKRACAANVRIRSPRRGDSSFDLSFFALSRRTAGLQAS